MLRVCQEAVENVIVEVGTQQSRPVVRDSGGPPPCHPQPSLDTGVAGKLPSALGGVRFHKAK